MKILFFRSLTLFLFLLTSLAAQSNFSAEDYARFLEENKNLTYRDLQSRFQPSFVYYKGFKNTEPPESYQYLDSIIHRFSLTDQERELLRQNHFVISERLRFHSFGDAFHQIYLADLPVFISSDAILHALHRSYDKILMDVEISILKPNLKQFLDGLYDNFLLLKTKYENEKELQTALKDVDLYLTMALSLLDNSKGEAQYCEQEKVDQLWDDVQAQQFVERPLFSERPRKLDFSQFTVRGHYTDEELCDYFKAMMWLGRIDFMLTSPPDNPWEQPWTKEEIRRMNIGAYLLNELIDTSGVRELLDQNNFIIDFMVGEPDNITPNELKGIIQEQGISNAAQLLNDEFYDPYLEALQANNSSEQKILSQYLFMNPFSSEPSELPVSYRLSGQRFIIDSYILFNVVYDRIVFEDKKIWRPLPNPLDAMFVLGNDDALPLIKEEVEQYKYGSQLAALRYLVNSYDPEFWESSLYNVWLNAIRSLNPPQTRAGWPLFMKTAAWQQEKLNTQLASWAQLRHDNLLYAKQSYTGATGCSFPYSFVEPYPQLYGSIARFAEQAGEFFSQFPQDTYSMYCIQKYFPQLKKTMQKLEIIAQKELREESLSEDDISFLKEMLFEGGESGEPPFTGWYADLFYDPFDASEEDYVIADVHTQPTDKTGNTVGRVLHVGVGDVNVGIFLAETPSDRYHKTAFIGPVMSYYELISDDFKRFNDEEWAERIESGDLPARPDWVSIFLCDSEGKKYPQGKELPSQVYTSLHEKEENIPGRFRLYQNYPNPFNPLTIIRYQLPFAAMVEISIYDISGREVATLVHSRQPAGKYEIPFNAAGLAAGVYFCQMRAQNFRQAIKLVLVE